MKLVQPTEMVPLEDGGFIFDGQVTSDGQTYARGQFISQNRTIQALTKSAVLIFKEIAGLKINQDERMSVVND